MKKADWEIRAENNKDIFYDGILSLYDSRGICQNSGASQN